MIRDVRPDVIGQEPAANRSPTSSNAARIRPHQEDATSAPRTIPATSDDHVSQGAMNS